MKEKSTTLSLGDVFVMDASVFHRFCDLQDCYNLDKVPHQDTFLLNCTNTEQEFPEYYFKDYNPTECQSPDV